MCSPTSRSAAASSTVGHDGSGWWRTRPLTSMATVAAATATTPPTDRVAAAERVEARSEAAPKRSRSATSSSRTTTLSSTAAEAGPVHQVQDQGGGQQHGGHQPGAALAPQDAPGQHHQPDAGQRHQGPGRLGHAEGQVLADQVEVAGGRPADRHQQVEQPGQEDGPGGQPPHPAHPDPAGGHSGRRRPGGAPGPRGHHGRVQVGRLLVALHHLVPGGDALEGGRGGEVGVGQQQADVEIGPGLQLDQLACRWWRKTGGSPNRPGCSRTSSVVPPGQAKKPWSRWMSSARSPPPVTRPVAPLATSVRASSRASVPADQQAAGQRCLAGVGRRPSGPRAPGGVPRRRPSRPVGRPRPPAPPRSAPGPPPRPG